MKTYKNETVRIFSNNDPRGKTTVVCDVDYIGVDFDFYIGNAHLPDGCVVRVSQIRQNDQKWCYYG